MIKGCKIRLYPTKEQEIMIWKHIAACRYVWNYMLALQEERYHNGEKHLSGYDMIRHLTPLKKQDEYSWLNEVSCSSLQRVCGDLNNAYQRFYKKVAHSPRFKTKKKSKSTYPVCENRLYFLDSNVVQIQKLGKVKYKSDLSIPIGKKNKIINPRIFMQDDKWMLSFSVECENQALELTEHSMGIDLGVKNTMIVAYNDKMFVFGNINKSRKIRTLEKKIAFLQKKAAHKYECNKQGNVYIKTNNICRIEHKIRKLYWRISCIRMNYIHQTTFQLVKMRPRRIVMEDLNVKELLEKQHWAKSLQDQCFYEIRRQIQYKCEKFGIEFILADRFFPSSKTCSHCGYVKSDLSLSDRIFICPLCGLEIDRDYQAALNLSKYETHKDELSA